MQHLDVLPLFSSPVVNTCVDVDAKSVLEKLKTLEFRRTDHSLAANDDTATGISESLSILNHFPELKKAIEEKLEYFIREILLYKTVKYKITTSWGTETFPGGLGQGHIHSNSWLSGVYYPETCSSLQFMKVVRPFLQIENPEEWNIWNSLQWDIEPVENTLLLFDSQQNHKVSRNMTNDTRYSIAFNVMPIGRIGYSDSTLYINAK